MVLIQLGFEVAKFSTTVLYHFAVLGPHKALFLDHECDFMPFIVVMTINNNIGLLFLLKIMKQVFFH